MLYKSRPMQRACVRAGLVLSLLSVLSSGAVADSSLYVKAGATTGQTDGLLTDKPGLALGGALGITRWSPHPTLTFVPQLELLLARRNASLALDGTANQSYSMDFIELPLLLRTELTVGSRSLYALAGAYASVLLQAQRTRAAGIIDRADIASPVDIGFLAGGGFELVSSAWGELFVEARYQRGYRALLPGPDSDGRQEALSLLLAFGLGPDISDINDISDISDSSSPSQNQRLALTMKSGPIASRFRSRAQKAATATYSPGVWFGGAYSPARFGSWMAWVPQLELAVVHRSGQDTGLADGSLALDYIDLSLLMRAELPLGRSSIYGIGGLYGSALLRAQRSPGNDGVITDLRDTIRAIDAGWIAGVGIERAVSAKTRISVELRYQRGFRDLLPSDPSELTQHSIACLFGLTYGRARSPASSPSLPTTDSPLSETDVALDAINTKLYRLITAMEASSAASQWHRPGTSRCRSQAATPANVGVFAMPIECASQETQQETRAALHTVLLALTRDLSTLVARLKRIFRDVYGGEQQWIALHTRILVPTLEHLEWVVDDLHLAQDLLEHADQYDDSSWQRIGHPYEAALLGAQVLSLWTSWLEFARYLWLGTTLDLEWISTRTWNAWKDIDPVLVQLQSIHLPRFQRAAQTAVHKLPEWSDALYRWGKEAENRAHETAELVQKLQLIQAVFDLVATRQIVGSFAGRTGAYVFMLPGIGGMTASGAATGVRVVISAEWVAAMQHLIAIGAITTVEIAKIAGVSSMATSAGKAPQIPSGTGGGPSPERQAASKPGAQAEGRSAPAAKPASGSAASNTTGIAARGTGEKADDMLHVTPEGVALPKGPKHKIPDGYVENPHRPGSYGEIVNGKFNERLRIDPATAPGRKGPNHSHYHRDGKGTHYSPAPGDKDPGFQP